MDFNVVIGEPRHPILSEESAPSAPVNQAGEDAKAELSRVMNDPTHKHFEGFKRGAKDAEAYVNEWYRKAYGSEQVEIGKRESAAVSTGGPDDERDPDRVAQLEADAAIRNALGESYEADLADVEHELRYLAGDEQGQQAYQVFAPRISELGPRAEVLTVKFLRDLRKLRNGG